MELAIIWVRDEKAPAIDDRGKLGGGIRPSHRAECFLVALPTC